MTINTRADVVALLQQRGGLAYEGEGVTQLQHGWLCARIAQLQQASTALQLAAWLHDIGHLISTLPGSPTLAGIDDSHEALGGRLLRRFFGPAVAGPVALHVGAKRYLVATQPAYAATLSADSLRSLVLQGGSMTDNECTRFIARPHARQALRLRHWDDAAKTPGLRPHSEGQALAELAALMAAVPALPE